MPRVPPSPPARPLAKRRFAHAAVSCQRPRQPARPASPSLSTELPGPASWRLAAQCKAGAKLPGRLAAAVLPAQLSLANTLGAAHLSTQCQ